MSQTSAFEVADHLDSAFQTKANSDVVCKVQILSVQQEGIVKGDLGIIQGLDAPLVGADIVEFNPKRDHSGVTAMAAVKFLKEIVGQMLK